MSNPYANALALALLEAGLTDSVTAAKEFSVRFFEENPIVPIVTSKAPVVVPTPARPVGPTCKNCGEVLPSHLPMCTSAPGNNPGF